MKMWGRVCSVGALALGYLASPVAQAGVNVNNGNFYIAYTDFVVTTPGLNIDITRTYNSRSSHVKGYFGVGWSSEWEGYLKIEKANIAYFEGGGGNVVNFKSSGSNTWKNELFGLQTITKDAQGYLLATSSGKMLRFNAAGKMSRIQDRAGNFIEVLYNKDGQMETLRDNTNNQVKLSWKTFGNAPRIVRVDRDKQKASYTYSPQGNLIKSVGMDGVAYSYSYDDEFNMTKIAYSDGTYKEMAYNKARDWITRFRDRDRLVTTYDYFSDNLDPENKFGTEVSRYAETRPSDKEVSKFWYEFRKRADGSRFNYKAVTSIAKTVTETIFTECCGTPLVIGQWTANPTVKGASKLAWIVPPAKKSITSFEYYPDGLLKKKTTPDGIVTTLTYDRVHRKVASVQKGPRKINYSYDKTGNLRTAYDAEAKRTLDLSYDGQGRISSVLEKAAKAQRTVYFRYDGAGRPIEIKEKQANGKEGIVRMNYNAAGEVTGIMNAKGKALSADADMESARQVAMTFQNLLEIVQPAGVTLTPEG